MRGELQKLRDEIAALKVRLATVEQQAGDALQNGVNVKVHNADSDGTCLMAGVAGAFYQCGNYLGQIMTLTKHP